MDVFKDLEETSQNLMKLRDSIFENELLGSATAKQKETFYKMLKSLTNKTQVYMREFDNKNHVMKTVADLDKLKDLVPDEDITFYINTFSDKLDWYYKKQMEDSESNFIAAADMIILWPLRLINERMYRYLFNKTLDARFDRVFIEID